MRVSVSAALKELDSAVDSVASKAPTYATLLRQCRSERSLVDGKLIHEHILQQRGPSLSAHLGNLLVQMYGKCGDIQTARSVFDAIPHNSRTVVSWSLLIAAYAQEGHCRVAIRLFEDMTLQGPQPSDFTVSVVLSACGKLGSLSDGRSVHSWATANGLESSLLVKNALVSMYSKCGSFGDARTIFNAMGSNRSAVTWNSLISAYAGHGFVQEAFDLYAEMLWHGVEPSSVTFVVACGACANLADLRESRRLHSRVFLSGFHTCPPVQNALVNMYAKCGSVADAKSVFESMQRKSVVSWSSMIAAYAWNGHGQEGIDLYHEMESQGVQPSAMTFTTVLNALSSTRDLEEGRRIHRLVSASPAEPNVILENALLNMYAKCGSFEEAEAVFEGMQLKVDVISWTNMIGACVYHARGLEALVLFHRMNLEGVPWNSITMASVLEACSICGARRYGRRLHQQVELAGYAGSRLVQNGLIVMYARFGCLEESRRIFSSMENKTLVAWTAMISAYAQHGCGHRAMELFKELNLEGNTLDSTTFTCILAACNHAGLLEEGREIFKAMVVDHCITPLPAHYSKTVDSIARAGRLQDAEELIEMMPFEPDSMAWKTLLNACRTHGQVETGARAAEQVADFDTEDGSLYVMLSNIGKLASDGCIEIQDKAHELVYGTRCLPEAEELREHPMN